MYNHRAYRPPSTKHACLPDALSGHTVPQVSSRRRSRRQHPTATEWTPATSQPGEIYTPTGRARSSRAFFLGLRNRRRTMELDRGGFTSAILATLMLVLAAAAVVSALRWLLGL